MISPEDQLKLFRRGAVEVISEEEFLKKIKDKKRLRVKAGFDPTAPDLHLGHTVLLQKLKQFQDLGHEVTFLIGDYTAKIGDPSGRTKTRPPLSEKEIKKNLETYKKQAFKILDKKKTKIRFNSEWLSKMNMLEFMELTSKQTVSRMLEKDGFGKRFREHQSISIVEFLYPLMQGYDSVRLKADVELGGTDQLFNLLIARTIQESYGDERQVIMTFPLLIGTDGIQKMSKSYGNHIGISESPKEMFGKLMAISDELMWNYYELLSAKSMEEISGLKEGVQKGSHHPKKVKEELALEIVTRFHSSKEAQKAAEEFQKVFAAHGLPSDIEEVTLPAGKEIPLIQLLADLQMVTSKGEARRMIKQGAVSVNEERIVDEFKVLKGAGEALLKVGKRRFKKLKFQ
ncbi:MAG: tyrosine--tRNA ligase [bacterium]|nr:tyrosine--tRNA ligase [bacterium]